MTLVELVRSVGTHFEPGYVPNGGVDREPNTFHLHFEPHSESVTEAVVRAAAFVHNTDHEELTPLAEVIDPDALNDVLQPRFGGQPRSVEVTFSYEDLRITVHGDGDIWLRWE